MSKNATKNSQTLLRLLADWRKPEFPAKFPVTEEDRKAWLRGVEILDRDLVLTVHFAEHHINNSQSEDRYYFTLCKARTESLNTRGIICRMKRKCSLAVFKLNAEKLIEQYVSLGSLVITLYELREPLLMRRVEAAL
jgi:hypothetical protein